MVSVILLLLIEDGVGDARHRLPHLLVPSRAQTQRQGGLDVVENFLGRYHEGGASHGEPKNPLTPISLVGFAREIAEALEIVEQRVEGLLRQPNPLGQFRGMDAVWAGEAEDFEVRRPDVSKASLVQSRQEHPVRGLGATPQQSADHRFGEARVVH